MRTIIIILILIAAAAIVVYRAQRTEHPFAPETPLAPAPQPITNAASLGRQSFFVSTNAQDPEFAERVLPVVREFFATLDRAGVNPLKGELKFNKVQIHHGRNGMDCRFLIGDSWTATIYTSSKISGIMHFGERGPDNPFGATSEPRPPQQRCW